MLSPLYKVREFKVEDRVPSSITFTWQGSNVEEKADGDEEMPDAAETSNEKSMPVFDCKKDRMDTRKYVTWKRDSPFSFQVGYTGASTEGQKRQLGDFYVNLPHQDEKKKVKIEAKVSLNGVFSIESATLVEIEEYEETVKEKREIIVEGANGGDAADNQDSENDSNTATEEVSEKKEGEEG